jgi:ABC-type bacteriocin/lantibiotic exporter with double-glycine peptidase domain
MKFAAVRSLAVSAMLACVAAGAAPAGLWLDVPFVRQEKNGCGAAAISMVMKYWNKDSARIPASAVDPQVIFQALYKQQARGIEAADMEHYFRANGFAAYAFKGNWNDLAHHLAKGRPLIVCLKEGRRGDPLHYVVVAGISENIVMVNDPAQRKLLKLDRMNFEKSWKAMGNWTLLALPQ